MLTVPKMIKTRSSTCSMTSSSEVRYCLLMLTTGSILGSQALWYTGLNYNNRHLLLITGIIRKNNKMAKIMEFKIFQLWCIGLSLKYGFNNVFVLLNHQYTLHGYLFLFISWFSLISNLNVNQKLKQMCVVIFRNLPPYVKVM